MRVRKSFLVGYSFRIFCVLFVFCLVMVAEAKNPIRSDFFDAYPSALGTNLEVLPSSSKHCGVCHYDFNGGGARNPFGLAVEGTSNHTPSEILALGSLDSDNDGYSNETEILGTSNGGNTPTFPGLSPAHASNVSNIPLSEIQNFMVPSTGADTSGPDITLISPNGGEVVIANGPFTIQWTADDPSGVAAVDILLSDDSGASFKIIAIGVGNTGSYTWYVANRPTNGAEAMIKIVATDNAFNSSEDASDAVFDIDSPVGGNAPTTLRDFDMPGTQPFEAGTLNSPDACVVCHGGYDQSVEPGHNWQGSMMSQASLDPIFKAAMVIANQDAPDSGDVCLRCHFPRGWLNGRSIPTDGSQMLEMDKSGVACDFCHRMVDPINDGSSPGEDADIIAALSNPPSEFGNGMAILDPTGARRGPFVDATSGHPVLVSPFHREAALCGTCHNVSNPAFEKDGNGNYVPNEFDKAATDFSPNTLLPIERTYSEWLNSDYNTPTGVYAPRYSANKDFAGTCQDCHMQDVTGKGCNLAETPERTNLPLHDMTGGSAWMAENLSVMYPGQVDEAALADGAARSRALLRKAADLDVVQFAEQLRVKVTNRTGHKLPTGYPEGRRVWVNVKFRDESGAVIKESAAYDTDTAELAHDAEAKIYETEPGLDSITAPLVGEPEGPSFHFVLNNKIHKDNRIPPQGFKNADFAVFGGSPVGYSYADGQFWDFTYYDIPQGTASADVTLYYQSTSKEFIEFLRDENTTNSMGQDMYNLWEQNGKCPPETMNTAQVSLMGLPLGNVDNDGDVDLVDFAIFAAAYLSSDSDASWNVDCNLDNSNSTIDVFDLAIFINNWLGGVP